MTAAAGLVLMAVAAGELSTVTDIDIVLAELGRSNHRDQTWRELVDALLDCRSARSLEKSSRLHRA